ncbi:interleukin-26 [Brachyistius frenatus]|uniref:interleukin-26 n=1 Tax=Brachyistius frenatus TaxID=100188 RepID=UPI0037E8F9B9
MSLPVVRTTALAPLAHLIIIMVAAVATATVKQEPGPTCRQEIPSELIRDLWSRNRLLINDLPKEENFSRRQRLLPEFCTKCPERLIGWPEVKELIDIYQRSVFSSDVIQKLLPLHYDDLLYRLQHTLQQCVFSAKRSKYLKLIKKLERKIKKTRDEGALKAVGEFTFILRWINELAQHHIP